MTASIVAASPFLLRRKAWNPNEARDERGRWAKEPAKPSGKSVKAGMSQVEISGYLIDVGTDLSKQELLNWLNTGSKYFELRGLIHDGHLYVWEGQTEGGDEIYHSQMTPLLDIGGLRHAVVVKKAPNGEPAIYPYEYIDDHVYRSTYGRSHMIYEVGEKLGIEVKAWDASKHPRGQPDNAGQFASSPGQKKPAVHVADDPKLYTDLKWDNWNQQYVIPGFHDMKQPSGAPIRGKPMSPDDERIPDTVYHMTTNLPAVLESGILRASGEGGLGGDKQDQIVSMTISKEIAIQLADDMKFAVNMLREFGEAPPIKWNKDDTKWEGTEQRNAWGKPLVAKLSQIAEEEGWKFTEQDGSLDSYGLGDWLRNYFSLRESKTKKLNPLIYDAESTLAKLDPDKIGIVSIPKSNLKTGALITNFDLENPYGLKEIRAYGDVPIGGEAKSFVPVTKSFDYSIKTSGPHKYACVMLPLPPAMAKHITDWTIENIPDYHLSPEGREFTPHITALYGLHDDDPEAVREVLNSFGNIKVTLGRSSLFRGGKDGDVLKVNALDCHDLHKLNSALRQLPHTNKFPEYLPHVTLAYLEPEFADAYDDLKIPTITDAVVVFDDAQFSAADGTKTMLRIGRRLFDYGTKWYSSPPMLTKTFNPNEPRDEAGKWTRSDVIRHIEETNPPEHVSSGKMTMEEWADKYMSDEPDGYSLVEIHPAIVSYPVDPDGEKVRKYQAKPGEPPPIVIDSNDKMQARIGGGKLARAYGMQEITVIDGKHRAEASRSRGDKKIRAFVPNRKLEKIIEASHLAEMADFAESYAKGKQGTEIKVSRESHWLKVSFVLPDGRKRELSLRDLERVAANTGVKFTWGDKDFQPSTKDHSTSHFANCPRDKTGHCLPKGQADQHADKPQSAPAKQGKPADQAKPNAAPPDISDKPADESAARKAKLEIARLGAMSWDALKRAGAAVGHVEHVAKEWIAGQFESNVSKLPPSLEKIVRGVWKGLRLGGKTLFATYIAGQALAEKVAKANGLDDEAAARLRAVLTTVDIATYKPVQIGLLMTGVGAGALLAASLVPIGSSTYLAYSAARASVTKAKQAAKLIAGVIGRKGHEPESKESDKNATAQAFVDGLLAAKDQDMYFACVMEALDQVHDLPRAIKLAIQALDIEVDHDGDRSSPVSSASA